ncbi:EscU/YscU/HrcU family type III secretion system export apparatus switch protein [Roseiconus lacunae]|uniref:EscU/YscU/HrcU family type III secretion system export apparatus switch protein n=1 Tax=Roseiconus lacunae TaxID=2605694 RepID=A0ABT7PIQ3_9BACT|nr:EscU/YscU/HrcU family type III secretion system export apparatus switch protein [Roseiconus lacunae]MCD0458490.1 EscU/YscU/HrcU family type III secretion system export apparatus switch protein [Roseiconus lacunae]MDM4016378.1 EscU/YscU/HrcU family type III secretion system export apparatus switch protein [Roseiconus lacunae]WRQ52020.1 EscU/YscU/HrcU family type III secretion system export apparatus switch protein [Stieleria sp. HD01]
MSEKIHPPTPKKRQEAKEQGRGPRSQELVSAATLLAAIGMLSWSGPRIVRFLMLTIEESVGQSTGLSIDSGEVITRIIRLIFAAGLVLLPLMIGLMLIGLASGLMQSGGRVAFRRLVPSWNRLSPLRRGKAILGPQALLRFSVSVMKLIAIVCVATLYVRSSLPLIACLGALTPAAAGAQVFTLLIDCAVWVGATVLFFACVDYAIAWWQHEQDLMMTDLELREEIRNAQRSAPRGGEMATNARTGAVQGVT